MLWSTKWNPAEQHCYVTGGSSGLGLELSKVLASRGAHVSIVARDEKKLASAIQEIEKCRRDSKQIIQSFSHSLLTAAESKAALDDVVATHHGSAPDVVFLCAGKSKPRFFLEYTPEELSEGMDDAYWAQVWTAHAATRLMVEQDRRGKIVFVSSTLGLMTVPGYASYVPAKHALRGLADMLRTELILYGIDVHIFFPPTMLTPGYETENKTKPKITLKIEEGDSPLTAEQAAEILFKGVSNNQFQITGNFITELFRASSREASPRRIWFLDGFLGFLAYVSVPIWARSVDKLMYEHRKDHLQFLLDQGVLKSA
ncbi:oxidoreductase [Dentipellis sp. KUC8613]|nr:oxidoreductase [Dentipellis sp. KUC8613]